MVFNSDAQQPLNSIFTTLRERGIVNVTNIIPSFTIPPPTNSTVSKTVSVKMPNTTAASFKRFRINGTTVVAVDNIWYYFDGFTRITDTNTPDGYLIHVTSSNDGINENFLFTFTNNKVAATVTVPTLTITVVCRFFDAPWEAN